MRFQHVRREPHAQAERARLAMTSADHPFWITVGPVGSGRKEYVKLAHKPFKRSLGLLVFGNSSPRSTAGCPQQASYKRPIPLSARREQTKTIMKLREFLNGPRIHAVASRFSSNVAAKLARLVT